MKEIAAVPDSISRADWLRLIESVGFDPNDLQELYFAPDGVHAVVYATDDDGEPLFDGEEAATHRIHIPVRDA